MFKSHLEDDTLCCKRMLSKFSSQNIIFRTEIIFVTMINGNEKKKTVL